MTETANLLARYLVGQGTLEEERALLAHQPAAKQKIVEHRLRILDRFLTSQGSDKLTVEAAATELGVKRRQFYQLITKLRDVGPVRALSPGFRNVVRRSQTREGLSEGVDAAIRKQLAARPLAKIGELVTLAELHCSRTGEPFPGQTAIRRRVHELRRASLQAYSGKIGADIVVDQIALELALEVLGTSRLSTLTLIIDRESKWIFGFSLTTGDGMGLGLQAALFNAQMRNRGEMEIPFAVSPTIERLTWVVPPGLEKVAGLVDQGLGEKPVGPEVAVLAEGPRRHGDLILRLLGDRLGLFPFRKYTQLGWDAPVTDLQPVETQEAMRLMSWSVDKWNEALAASDRAHVGQMELQDRRQGVQQLMEQLQNIFAPVLAEIEHRQDTIGWYPGRKAR